MTANKTKLQALEEDHTWSLPVVILQTHVDAFLEQFCLEHVWTTVRRPVGDDRLPLWYGRRSVRDGPCHWRPEAVELHTVPTERERESRVPQSSWIQFS